MRGPRPAYLDEMPALAHLWHDGWHEAHAALLPPAFVARRVLAGFASRLSLPRQQDRLRCAGPRGAPLGLCIVKDHEIDPLLVAPAARGTGLATRLLADGEARLRAAGVTIGELACLPENIRATRFYRRHGWIEERRELRRLEGPEATHEATHEAMHEALFAIMEKHL